MPRTVVVTGGGTGIGRSIAERFASAGDSVVVVGRRAEMLKRVVAENPAAEITAVQADLTERGDVLRVVEELSGRGIDVLVNNAGGVVKDEEPGLEGAFDAYRRTIDANLLAPMMLT